MPRDAGKGTAIVRSSSLPEGVRTMVPLYVRTSIRVGGPASFLAEPADAEDLQRLLRWADRSRLARTTLGGGTNVIFRDAGYSGLVVSTRRLRGLDLGRTRLVVGAGEPLSAVAWRACRAGLSGLEWACGMPGTVGGAVVMNAGTKAGETADVLTEVVGVCSSGAARWPPRQLGFGYRTSAFLTGIVDAVVTEATFALVRASVARVVETARRLVDERSRKLPSGATAGCTFRNPSGGPTAGELLDRAGCKGMSVGAARVSETHANFLINDGERNAADLLQLIEQMKRRVSDAFGVDLEEEVILYPP